MKNISSTQLIIGGIILYLLLLNKGAKLEPQVVVKPAPALPIQPYTSTPRTSASQSPNDAVAGDWEINCYHQVV